MPLMLRDRIMCFFVCCPQNMKVTMYGTKAVESHLDIWGTSTPLRNWLRSVSCTLVTQDRYYSENSVLLDEKSLFLPAILNIQRNGLKQTGELLSIGWSSIVLLLIESSYTSTCFGSDHRHLQGR